MKYLSFSTFTFLFFASYSGHSSLVGHFEAMVEPTSKASIQSSQQTSPELNHEESFAMAAAGAELDDIRNKAPSRREQPIQVVQQTEYVDRASINLGAPETPECMMHMIIYIQCLKEQLKYLDVAFRKKINLFQKTKLHDTCQCQINNLMDYALKDIKPPHQYISITRHYDSNIVDLSIKVKMKESVEIPPSLFEKFDMSKTLSVIAIINTIKQLIHKNFLVCERRQQFQHLC